MRKKVMLIGALVAFAVTPLSTAAAQERWTLGASVGPSFGNIGTTVAAHGWAGLRLGEAVWVTGELGALPRVPIDKASEIASPLPALVEGADQRVNGYHANANLQVAPIHGDRVLPYVTAGVGSFVADSVGTGRLGTTSVRERERAVDFATNLGGGVTYRLTDRIGLNADYRTFFVHRDDTRRVHRFASGVSFFLW